MTSRPGVRGLDRRAFLGLGGAVGAAAAVTACGGPIVTKNGSGTSSTIKPPDFSGVKPASKITFWTDNPGSSQQVTQQIIDKFTARTKIQVELVTAGSNYDQIAQKFQTARVGGGVPDLIVLSDVWWFRYYLQGSIIPLDTALAAAEIDPDDYVPTFFNDYRYDGHQWAVPWARSTPLFYYNKNHWRIAGLPDRAPTTWEEFSEWAPRLQSVTGRTGAQHAFEYTSSVNTPAWVDQSMLWGEGAALSAKDSFTLTIDAPEVVSVFQRIQDNIRVNKWAIMAGSNEANDFSAGAASATWGSTGSSVGIQKTATFEIGVGFLPGGSKVRQPVCPTGGAGLGIAAQSSPAKQLAAARFIAFLTNAENTVTFGEATGYLPVRTKVDTAALRKANPLVGTPLEQLARTRSQDWARVFIPGADTAMTQSITQICNSGADVHKTLSQLQEKVQGLYTRQVEPKIS